MASEPIGERIMAIGNALEHVARFMAESPYSKLAGDPTMSDFTLGNPQEMPLPGFVAALEKWSVPQNKKWFAYKNNEPASQAVAAASLRERRGLPFHDEDILLTNGAFAAIAVSLCALIDPGDEVIFISPPWFFYEALIATYAGRAVRVMADRESFDLDIDAIAGAITAKTRAIIVNSPNNPSGKIYPASTLTQLADLLTAASKRNGRTIYLLSDEAYSRIIFDGRDYPSPVAFYPESLLLYTYAKTLLTPGQRIGYIALSPTMTNRETLRQSLFLAQLVTGFAFPNALLQHALPDIENLSIDIPHLQHKRDLVVGALREMGYSLHTPEGTFYLMVRSPWEDDVAFVNLLASHKILCLPGTVVETPGYFRISLTASDDMIERALPNFAAALQEASAAIG
ncbi:MAG: aminotransferase class I/II-fold pyridoxal phosphate-dependent enzyme [Chloroflexota bacterium]